MGDDAIKIPKERLVSVLRNLEMIVVSLDRIGSAAADLGPEEYRRASSDFLDDWDVARRLASARRILSEPFSDEVGPDDMDELERELQHVEHWTVSKRKPVSKS